MIVVLSEAEQRLASFIGKARHLSSRKQGIKDLRRGDKPADLIDREGAAAEIAFCKAFNIYPDLDVGDKKVVDCTLSSGHTVDVKWTSRPEGMLITVPWKKPKVDIFALVIGTMPEYRIAGWMLATELIKEERLRFVGNNNVYAATQGELVDPKSLLDVGHSWIKETTWNQESLESRN
jgi:hypothetical protein